MSIHRQPHREDLVVFPNNFVLADRGFRGVASVLGGGGGRKVPFHIGCARDEGDVVQVEDAEVEGEFWLRVNSTISDKALCG